MSASSNSTSDDTTMSSLEPKRFIFSDDDMNKFSKSPAKASLLKLVAAMGKSCASTGLTYRYDPVEPLAGLSPATAALHGSLTEMTTWMAQFAPPVKPSNQVQVRFGNPAFRTWHQHLTEHAVSIVHTLLKMHQQYPISTEGDASFDLDILKEAERHGREAAKHVLQLDEITADEDRAVIAELCAYLGDSFGHPVRLDYGTGHESSFQVLLLALCKLGCFTGRKGSNHRHDEPPSVERLKAITLAIYSAYLNVTRQLQTDYMLEPAGSHGVWGLDDYHCLPFYFGACQLQAENDDADVRSPSSIHEDRVLQERGDQYLYMGCIRYIKSLKQGVPFFESSPMLNDISNLPTWQKVASGLLRLYEGEVLDKRQVVQHFVFGTLFAADWTPSEAPRAPPVATNFREPGATGVVAPMAVAPWARQEQGNRNAATAGTVPMPPTRAPWAK